MKKLLLSSAALCGLSLMAAPAQAAGGVDLEIGGWFKGYGVFVDQDTSTTEEEREFDILRNTEIHFTGETTLDNGLTVGYHLETDADNDDSFDVQESYAYFSGGWGRVNFGAEDGASYLLQVEAPSADGNVDGIRQYIDGVAYTLAPAGTISDLYDGYAAAADTNVGAAAGGGDDVVAATAINIRGKGEGAFDMFSFDYDDDVSSYSNKITYLTPIFGGFQAGVSYTPDLDADDANDDTAGVNQDNSAGDYGDVYEIAARYEGQFDGFGVIIGAGYTHAELEASQTLTFIDADNDQAFDAGETIVASRDDRQSWNAGIDLDIGPFGIGVAYTEDDLGVDDGADRDTVVVGADYTTGPFKLGASYYTQDQELDAFRGNGSGELETDRYTGGVVYTYGPGMTFRGSVSYIENEVDGSADVEATSVLLGTQIKF